MFHLVFLSCEQSHDVEKAYQLDENSMIERGGMGIPSSSEQECYYQQPLLLSEFVIWFLQYFSYPTRHP